MMTTTRRNLLIGAGALSALPFRSAAAGPLPFSFDTVKAKAKSLADAAFVDRPEPLPDVLRKLDYDHYRMINFRSDQAIWRDSGKFQIQLFHRGFLYDRKVTVNLVEDGVVTPVAYSPNQFDFRANAFKADFGPDLGFAGLRIHFPLNRRDYFDEFVVFQGASYFRVVGKGQTYGISARALAIDTAQPQGEEFPFFREFWVERPAPHARMITLYALLDSKSTSGAYRFVFRPDTVTMVDVDAVLFPRMAIARPGLAAASSMFLHGKPDNRPFADIHPEVHDSDGLLMHNGAGEWLWRPLINPRLLEVASFSDEAPRGFGLMQRERDFAAYQDPFQGYESRPSLWVEPKGKWAPGSVLLVEIPTDDDSNDNIASSYVLKDGLPAKQPFAYGYRLAALLDLPGLSPLGRCVATRTGPVHPVETGKENHDGTCLFAVDFAGPPLKSLTDTAPPVAAITASTGRIADLRVERLPNAAWRVRFVFTPDAQKSAEMRLALRSRGRDLTETWSYLWTRDSMPA